MTVYPVKRFLSLFGIGVDKDIPRMQRRGAIIVLGMLALAKREIVTERVDTLLKIGLGNLGKVSEA